MAMEHKGSKIGKNSVNYNPITLEYHQTDAGKKLAEEDAKSLYRTAMRSAHLYLKNNTFNPMRCQDIPRRLVAELSPSLTNLEKSKSLPPIQDLRSAEKKAKDENPHVTLDIPRQLIAVAAHTATLVKDRLGPAADGVLIAGKGTPRLKSLPKDRVAELKGTMGITEGVKMISVEVEGEGKDHNWSRHF
ncbi:hypothetical protein BC829DRAFT_165404 [Chytridium lagenaria]|nr:hypothetical protein BC829DRAFT_165404 [Chytridium lagenaria]